MNGWKRSQQSKGKDARRVVIGRSLLAVFAFFFIAAAWVSREGARQMAEMAEDGSKTDSVSDTDLKDGYTASDGSKGAGLENSGSSDAVSEGGKNTNNTGCTCGDAYTLPVIVLQTNGKEIPTAVETVSREVGSAVYSVQSEPESILAQAELYGPGGNGFTCICGAKAAQARYAVQLQVAAGTEKEKKKSYILDFSQTGNIEGAEQLYVRGQKKSAQMQEQKGAIYSAGGVSLLGMEGHTRWLLNGFSEDSTFLKDALAQHFAKQILKETLPSQFCEVYVERDDDRSYKGIYLLTALPQSDSMTLSDNGRAIGDVSFVIQRDTVRKDTAMFLTEWGSLEEDMMTTEDGAHINRTRLITAAPGASALSDGEKEKILDYLNTFEYALYSSRFRDVEDGYQQYIDTDSFLYYSMISEVMRNTMAGDEKTFFSRQSGGKMKAGPVIWGFSGSCGGTDGSNLGVEDSVDLAAEENSQQDDSLSDSSLQDSGLQDSSLQGSNGQESSGSGASLDDAGAEMFTRLRGFHITSTTWFNRLFQDSFFSGRFRYLYRAERSGVWSDEAINRFLDSAVQSIGEKAILREQRLRKQGGMQDYERGIEVLKIYLKTRMAWIDENLQLVDREMDNLQ